VGGAYGSFLASILAKHSKLQGVLFDQSQASSILVLEALSAEQGHHPLLDAHLLCSRQLEAAACGL
jgi:hypothetical protein